MHHQRPLGSFANGSGKGGSRAVGRLGKRMVCCLLLLLLTISFVLARQATCEHVCMYIYICNIHDYCKGERKKGKLYTSESVIM